MAGATGPAEKNDRNRPSLLLCLYALTVYPLWGYAARLS